MIVLSYKYALRPTLAQRKELSRTLALHRKLYNLALERRIKVWEHEKRSVTASEEWRWWSDLRKANPEFAIISADCGQHTLLRLQQAYKRFFEDLKKGVRCGKPVFKSWRTFHSFVGRRSDMKLITRDGRMYLKANGVSSPIRVVYHRPLPEGCEVKQVRVVREPDRWYCVVAIEVAEDFQPQPIRRMVGIDVGIENLLALSDGNLIQNPRWFRLTEERLARLQRVIEKKKKGSKRRERAVYRLKRLHRKLKRQRDTFYHRLCAWLTSKYDLIAIEDLNVKGLQRGNLSKQVSDAAWGAFFSKLHWHAQKRGKRVVVVSAKSTSQQCAKCGQVVSKSLSDRWHECPHCGYSVHRDVNAAQNILIRACENISDIEAGFDIRL